jgi:hypothetical protein
MGEVYLAPQSFPERKVRLSAVLLNVLFLVQKDLSGTCIL